MALTAKNRAASTASASTSGKTAKRAALLIRMSTAPSLSTVVAIIRSQSAASATSPGTAKTDRPHSFSISSAAWVSVASVRPAIATRAPARAKARAIAKPIPAPPPVTTATLPSNSKGAGILGHRLEAARERADVFRRLDIEIGDLHAGVMGAERERQDVVGIVELGMMVHHLGLDGDFDNEGDRVAKGLELEAGLDVGRFERPVGQFSQRRSDLRVAQNLVIRHETASLFHFISLRSAGGHCGARLVKLKDRLFEWRRRDANRAGVGLAELEDQKDCKPDRRAAQDEHRNQHRAQFRQQPHAGEQKRRPER